MSDIIIPAAILLGMAALIFYSACITSGRERRRDERDERRHKYGYPTADQTSKPHPCGTCTHWEACNGVDWDSGCPEHKEAQFGKEKNDGCV